MLINAWSVGPDCLCVDFPFKNPVAGMVVHVYNPSPWEAETGRSPVSGQPGLHSKTLFQNKQQQKAILLDFFHTPKAVYIYILAINEKNKEMYQNRYFLVHQFSTNR
jgi:hypothetical protein